MKLITGNIVDTEIAAIAHGCNCQNGFNTGVAGAIKEKWPSVKVAYHEYVRANGTGKHLLGNVQVIDVQDHTIFNCFTQDKYGYDKTIYASYTAVIEALSNVCKICSERGYDKIAIPEIGCGRGGLEWDIVKFLLEELEGRFDMEFYVYKIDEWKR